MHRLFIFLFAAAILPVCVHAQQTFTLDGAIAESMDYITEKLPEKTKVAVLKVKTLNEELTDYISVECDNYIKDNTLLVLANKKQLPEILKRNNIADLNKASEEDVIKVAGLLGAKAVVFVGFDKRDGNYRFFIQMYDTETAQTNGMLALPVELDGLLADFTGETYISPEKRREMEREEELARVKKELEDIKAHNAKLQKEREAAKLQNQSDFEAAFDELETRKKGGDVRSRLESETAQKHLDIAEQKSPQSPALAAEPQNEDDRQKNKYFVFSFRPEIFTGRGATAFGADMELGRIGSRGLYLSADLSGGLLYAGVGFDIGGTINKDGLFKSVLGVTYGVWVAPIKVYIEDETGREELYDMPNLNMNSSGAFVKFMLGKTCNIDITNKLLFGIRLFQQNDEFDVLPNITWSGSIGFTLTKKKRN